MSVSSGKRNSKNGVWITRGLLWNGYSIAELHKLPHDKTNLFIVSIFTNKIHSVGIRNLKISAYVFDITNSFVCVSR